jgi:hypothetical protein
MSGIVFTVALFGVFLFWRTPLAVASETLTNGGQEAMGKSGRREERSRVLSPAVMPMIILWPISGTMDCRRFFSNPSLSVICGKACRGLREADR